MPFKKHHIEQLKLVTSFDWIDFEALADVPDMIVSVLSDENAYVRDVIFFKENAIGLKTALSYLQQESEELKKETLFYMIIVSEIDGITDFEENEFFQKITDQLGADYYNEVYTVAVKKATAERKQFKKNNSSKNTGKRANPNSTDNIFRITQ